MTGKSYTAGFALSIMPIVDRTMNGVLRTTENAMKYES